MVRESEENFRNFYVLDQYLVNKSQPNESEANNFVELNYDDMMTWKKLPVNAATMGTMGKPKDGKNRRRSSSQESS